MRGQNMGEKYQGSHSFGFERATLQFDLDISLGAKCWKSFYETASSRRFVFSFRFM